MLNSTRKILPESSVLPLKDNFVSSSAIGCWGFHNRVGIPYGIKYKIPDIVIKNLASFGKYKFEPLRKLRCQTVVYLPTFAFCENKTILAGNHYCHSTRHEISYKNQL